MYSLTIAPFTNEVNVLTIFAKRGFVNIVVTNQKNDLRKHFKTVMIDVVHKLFSCTLEHQSRHYLIGERKLEIQV